MIEDFKPGDMVCVKTRNNASGVVKKVEAGFATVDIGKGKTIQVWVGHLEKQFANRIKG